MSDFDIDADVNEYLQGFLNDISYLSPEIHDIFLELQKNDHEVEEILKRNRIIEKKLWDLMDGTLSEDSDEDDEDTESDDEDEINENQCDDNKEDTSQPSNKRRRLEEESDIRGKKQHQQEKEQKLKEIIGNGYEKAIELSEVKCTLVTKALNLVKRYSKQINDDFAAFFPDHTLPEYSDTSGNVSFMNSKNIFGGKKKTVTSVPPLPELESTYCYCNQGFFGTMIGCDGEDCSYEWFHIECVGLDKVPKGKWYCDDCENKQTSSRKRKRVQGDEI
ncbi:4858_t:CDS:2 [Ambispora leptoticha]|uniref:Chromatin modification-related protein n=1 Tax=Ambispora leptoticha TaxID=144679 RepID=A0A9N9DFW6_9GLOM|nr:4858_t:CDS:2 [Ambispora leptoticha]